MSDKKNKFLKFPPDFLWGAASSAYQVEGGIESNDWAVSKRVPPAGRACDHYNRYQEDFILAKQMHHNAHRLSLEWSRIQPEKGKWDEQELEHYRKVLQSLKDNGFSTFVTLHHFTNPVWFAEKGGWLKRKNIDYFASYTEKITAFLGELVDFWLTINEPNMYARQAYLEGAWPPFVKNPISSFRVYKNLLLAHNRAYQIIHRQYPRSKVGFSQHIAYNKGGLIARLFDLMTIDYPFRKTKNDFLGLNHYFAREISLSLFHLLKFKDLPGRKSDRGWSVYPEGLYKVLLKLKKFKKPVIITENGLADKKDQLREEYVKGYLEAVQRAIRDGVDVRGYLHWSLLDNFEWEDGYKWKFGLVEVDFSTPGLKRTVRESAKVYGEICKTNIL